MTPADSSNSPSLSPGRTAVIGAGASGCAAAMLAQARGATEITVYDTADETALRSAHEALSASGIGLICGEELRGLAALPPCDTVIFSPGVPADSPLGKMARQASKNCFGELGFAARYCPLPIYAVTGTNGKTTTTELLTACLNAAGCTCLSGGNIGLPLSRIILDGTDHLKCVVVEVSSFQMEFSQGFAPELAILLNITPDHLNRHGSFEAYRDTKLRCLRQVKSGGHIVLNSDCRDVISTPAGVSIRYFGSSADADTLRQGDLLISNDRIGQCTAEKTSSTIITAEELQLKGAHNLQNAAAVIGAMAELGYPPEKYLSALREFKAGHHRIELIATHQGISCYDDSKATDVDALIKALETLGTDGQPSIHLIAGGLDKGCSLSEALPSLRRFVKDAFLIGTCRERLSQEWGAVLPCSTCDSMAEAVSRAFGSARPGDIILLSPACASMDMFKNYEERGKCFSEACKMHCNQ